MSKLRVKLAALPMNKLKLSLVLTLTAVILSGCVHTKFYSARPTPTPSPLPSPTSTPVVQSQSTGDVNTDLESTDQELQEDSDIPDITNSDLGL
jgi:PBP1b-binding outer membrane lipoprotein LpoB